MMTNDPLTTIEKRLRGIIETLKDNPIFRMSLGSKELFHSNFLEYLWYLDPSAFIKMLNALPSRSCKKSIMLNPDAPEKYYELGREEKNFDICIYHREDKVKYDLVLENKVKSIPYKEQLEEYVKKADKSQKCRFILLTLSQDFPDKNEIEDNWDIVGYTDLNEQIRSFYLTGRNEKDSNYHYINHYVSFVEKLCELKQYILPDNQLILSQQLFDNDVIGALKTIRLHDLYIKLRCSWFALELKSRLKNRKVVVVHKYEDIENDAVNINVDMNQGNGQIAAWICNSQTDSTLNAEQETKLKNTFEIVIQGNQYRHGINHSRILLPNQKQIIKDKYDRLNALYCRLKDCKDYQLAFAFLNNNGNTSVQPPEDKKIYFKNTKQAKEKDGPFNCYSDSYIYRYIAITKEDNIGKLMDRMITDISTVMDNPPKLV